jgi:hypothetical protein
MMFDDPSLSPIVEYVDGVLQEIQCSRACVAASAILLKVLERHNYPGVYPLSVRAEIMNPGMHDYVQRHGRPGREETNAELQASGAICSGIGHPPGAAWSGHMGIVIPNRGDGQAFIDMTVGQANVPERGINLGALCLLVGDDFVAGKQPHSEMVRGCHLTYTAYPADHGYDTGTNWMKMTGLDRAVQMVFTRMYGDD